MPSTHQRKTRRCGSRPRRARLLTYPRGSKRQRPEEIIGPCAQATGVARPFHHIADNSLATAVDQWVFLGEDGAAHEVLQRRRRKELAVGRREPALSPVDPRGGEIPRQQ